MVRAAHRVTVLRMRMPLQTPAAVDVAVVLSPPKDQPAGKRRDESDVRKRAADKVVTAVGRPVDHVVEAGDHPVTVVQPSRSLRISTHPLCASAVRTREDVAKAVPHARQGACDGQAEVALVGSRSPRRRNSQIAVAAAGRRPTKDYYRAVAGLRAELEALLEAVREGEVEPSAALEQFAALPYRDLGFARVDLHREIRQGAPEVVLAEGKTPDQIARIVASMLEGGAGSVLVSRADDAARAAVRTVAPDSHEHQLARAVWVARSVPEPHGRVTMVSAGTSDGAVLHEARIRAELLGTTVRVHEDAGVAGIHRLEPALDDLEHADCVVVCAGMDAALASVVGGLVGCPIIGVPTSVGYGSAHGGQTALNAMLCSCATGLAVVGIDDGVGAGTIAARIARQSA